MITPFLSTLGLVLLAEFGDKTQICALTLSLRYRKTYSVVLGAAFGFLLVDALAVIAGSLLLEFIPLSWIKIVGGFIFIAFGAYYFIKKDEEYCLTNNNRTPFISSFILISTTEMGDKTQIMVALLSAIYSNPLAVISGALIALVGLTAVTVIVGNRLLDRVPLKKIRRITPFVFIILGILQIAFSQ
ncbi:MAG: TMEM165/GDT1 family protein [Nitrososphaeria archaeon]